MKQFNSPVFWIMITISLAAGIVVLTVTPNVKETHCVLTSNDLDRLRSDTPLRQIVSRFEGGYYEDLRSGQLFDSRTGATRIIDEFESEQEAWLKSQIANLRVENDRLSRAIDRQDPAGATAHNLIQVRERLTHVWEMLPEDHSEAHREMLDTFTFIAHELEELGVTSRIDEQEVRLRHRPDRRIPLDDVLRQEEPQ